MCHLSVNLPLKPEGGGFESPVEGPQFSPYTRSALDLPVFAEVKDSKNPNRLAPYPGKSSAFPVGGDWERAWPLGFSGATPF